MNLEEIFNNEDISVRSYNVCTINGLKDLSSVINYYNTYHSFDNLRNCGRLSNNELIALCKKYSVNKVDSFKTVEQIIPTLNRSQRDVINSFVKINVENLSVRSQNAIKSFLFNDLKIKNITDTELINDSFDYYKIKNVGTKTVKELKLFVSNIKDFIVRIIDIIDEKELVGIKNKFLIQKTFSLSEIPSEIIKTQSVFKFIDFLIKQDTLYNKQQNVIFQKAFKIYNHKKDFTLDDIAKELNLSRERVRQIRTICLEGLFIKLQFLKNIDDDLLQKYSLDKTQVLIYIDETITQLINEINNTFFSKEFISYLIYIYWSDEFKLIGSTEDVLQPKYSNSKNRHNWHSFYLIKKEICNEFDFNLCVDDLENRLNERIDETYSFNFKSYLSKFLKSNEYELLFQISKIVEKIINEEFNLFIDLDDNLNFRRNTVKQVPEFAIEALEKLSVPSKIEEIYKLIEKDYPGTTKSQDALRGSLQRTPEIIYFGRSSTYGLKKWEIEKEGIRGGTIRDIVEDFLNDSNDPRHISEITDYVLEFRPKSNQNSIWTNIKLDESSIYKFFKGSKVGVSYKNYDVSFIQILEFDRIEKKTWEERYQMILNFTENEHRLPYSSGCPENEKKLYRWFNIQTSKCNQGKLDTEKEKLIKEIESKYQLLNGKHRKSNSNEKYVELIAFVKNNSRLPLYNKKEEDLYQFFHKQKKLFKLGALDQFEENSLIEVAKIIQINLYENKRN